jgi:hypothetical protein
MIKSTIFENWYNLDSMPSYGRLDKEPNSHPCLEPIDNGAYQQLSDITPRKDYDRFYFSDAKLRFDAMRKRIDYKDNFNYNTDGYLDVKE